MHEPDLPGERPLSGPSQAWHASQVGTLTRPERAREQRRSLDIPHTAFCSHLTGALFAPGAEPLTFGGFEAPAVFARSSAPFVSVHTLLELRAQHTFKRVKGVHRF